MTSRYLYVPVFVVLSAPFGAFGHGDNHGAPSAQEHGHHMHHQMAKSERSAPAMPQSIQRTENFRVAYFSDVTPIPVNKLHTWKLKVATPQGKPVKGASIRIAGDMPAHGHGLPTAPEVTREIADGVYLVEGLKFSMPGRWIMEFHIEANGVRDTAAFSLVLK